MYMHGKSIYTQVHVRVHILYIPTVSGICRHPGTVPSAVYFTPMPSVKQGWAILQMEKLRVGDVCQLPSVPWPVSSRAGMESGVSSAHGPCRTLCRPLPPRLQQAVGWTPVLQATRRPRPGCPLGSTNMAEFLLFSRPEPVLPLMLSKHTETRSRCAS